MSLPLIGRRSLDVGYGVLDMRAGQGLEWVSKQLEGAYKQGNYAAWYFDIIHTPNQTPTAMRVAGYVTDMIKHASKLPDGEIVVRMNTSDHKLKARNDLFKRAHEAGVRTVDQQVID